MSKKMSLTANIVNVVVSDPEDARRRRLLNILLLAMAAAALLTLVALLVSIPTGDAGSQEEMTALFTGIVLTLLGVAVVYLLNRYVSGTLSSVLFLLLWLAVAALSDEPAQVVNGRGLFVFAIPILASSVLLTSWASFIVAGLSSLVIAVIGLFIVGQAIPTIPAMIGFFVFALVSHLAAHSLERALKELWAANAALRESEETTRALLNAPTDVAALIDTQGIILGTNETMKDRFHRALDDGRPSNVRLVGACVWDLFPPDVAERRRDRIDHVIQTGQPVRFEDEREGIWNDNVIYPIRDRQGRVSKVAILARDITARKQADQRIAHLNRVLHALRAINQLVVREKDRDRLLESACRNFIETRSYHNAWIVLLDDEGNVAATAEAGREEEFLLLLVAQIERGELVRCAQEALKRPGIVVTNAPISECTDCPVSKHYGGRGAMTARLEHAGRVYGVMSVSVPRALVTDAEEITLFREVTEDIAFALRGIEMEEKRRVVEARARHLLERQTTVNQLALALGDTSDLDKIYHTIYEHVHALMDAKAFIISFYEKHTRHIHADFVITVGVVRDASAFPPIPLEEKGHGTQSQVIHTGEPVYIPDFRRAMEKTQTEYTIQEDGRLVDGPPPPKGEGEATQSALYVPMKIEAETVGVMQVQSSRFDAYGQEDVELLSALANVAAIAIQNARLFESLQRSNEELRRHREHLEDLVEERTTELRKMVNLMTGREVRMAELKDVIHRLRAQLHKAGLKPVADDPLLGES